MLKHIISQKESAFGASASLRFHATFEAPNRTSDTGGRRTGLLDSEQSGTRFLSLSSAGPMCAILRSEAHRLLPCGRSSTQCLPRYEGAWHDADLLHIAVG